MCPLRPRLLAVSGHDPTGGAGIQADIEAAGACSVAVSTLTTALTVQSSNRVHEVVPVCVDLLRRAADCLLGEIPFAGIKFGLLPSVESVEFAAELNAQLPDIIKLADPVLAASNGTALADAKVAQAIGQLLAPQLTLITPNRSELASLTGTDSVSAGAQSLRRAGTQWVLVTGADAAAEANEALIEHHLFGPDGCETLTVDRIDGQFHGSGCTLAASLAAHLVCGQPVPQAVRSALAYCDARLRAADRITANTALPYRGKAAAPAATTTQTGGPQ